MHITLEADYAIRIVNCLVDASQRMDAQKIADAACVSLRFSLKILRKLVSSGIVQSFKGAKGGYVLAKDRLRLLSRMSLRPWKARTGSAVA